ncbi:hypothetical protein ACFMPD_03730 [Sedimentitalea sp. HM32M-2]|uniref:hypothetical protein n=1 Tax=Sedimentitalea sp. HM32M-2 TaxID=3351566 RepID=UPI00362F4008
MLATEAESLVRNWYCASDTQPTLFVLNNVSAARVNRILDPVVAARALPGHGVRYAILSELPRFSDIFRQAGRLVIATPEFRACLRDSGIIVNPDCEIRDLVPTQVPMRVPGLRNRHAYPLPGLQSADREIAVGLLHYPAGPATSRWAGD